jgi:hypothetical protein
MTTLLFRIRLFKINLLILFINILLNKPHRMFAEFFAFSIEYKNP